MTAFVTCTRADIHDPVAAGGNAHVMLHHDDGVAGFDQPVELCDELLDVSRV